MLSPTTALASLNDLGRRRLYCFQCRRYLLGGYPCPHRGNAQDPVDPISSPAAVTGPTSITPGRQQRNRLARREVLTVSRWRRSPRPRYELESPASPPPPPRRSTQYIVHVYV